MRRAVLFISAFLILFGCLRLFLPDIELQLVGLDPIVAWIGVGSGLLGVLYGSEFFRLLDIRWVWRFLAVGLIAFAIFSMISPTIGGLRQTFMLTADTFVLLESGILFGLLSYEVHEDALPFFAYTTFVAQLLLRRLEAELLPQTTTATDHTWRHRHA